MCNSAESRYNGWRNYPTWRVQIELLDDWVSIWTDEVRDGERKPWASVSDLADTMKAHINETLEEMAGESHPVILEYALAFVEDCDWQEMAQSAFDDCPELIADDGVSMFCHHDTLRALCPECN